ncbi:MAG: FTR1 family protein [Rickettsiales bacterium]
MLAAAIITLRELVEICLIISIISAALNNFVQKRRILALGIGGGILISTLIAFSISYISNLFDHNGQEILNIVILSISIICIALTIIWINKHTKALLNKISTEKERILNNESNSLALILIIVMAISREGAELILFLHGIYASNQQLMDLVIGISIGATIGISWSIVFYAGLLRIPMKYFFKVINIMLILLAAGMSSQLANLLTTTDLVTVLYQQVWDSSWLINEHKIFGEIIHNLFGYTAKPSQLQVVFYLGTIFILFSLLNKTSQTKK